MFPIVVPDCRECRHGAEAGIHQCANPMTIVNNSDDKGRHKRIVETVAGIVGSATKTGRTAFHTQ